MDEHGPTVDRRKVLKGIGVGGGLGALAGRGLADGSLVVGSTGEATVEVPHILNGDEVLQWREVPRSWYEHIEHNKRVTRQVQDDYLDASGVRSIGAVRWDREFGGKNGLQVEVEVDPAEFDGGIPETIDGIPVTIEEFSGERRLANCDNLGSFNPAPGGVTVGPQSDGKDDRGTSFSEVETSSGTNGLMTAFHVIANSCDDDILDDVADQACVKFGTVIEYDVDADYAVIDPDSNHSAVGEIREENGTQYDVSGHYSESTICDFASNGTSVRKTGCTTGTHTGEVKKCHTKDAGCPSMEGHGVKAGTQVGIGDSGGPSYRLEEFPDATVAVVTHITTYARNLDGGTIDCSSQWCSDDDQNETFTDTEGAAFYHMAGKYGLSLT